MSMSNETIKRATEITIAAMGQGQSGSWIGHADSVSKFFETVAKKIDELTIQSD